MVLVSIFDSCTHERAYTGPGFMLAEVAYTDTQGVFRAFEKQLETYLRTLTNLHWRPDSDVGGIAAVDTTTRTVPVLKLRLSPEGSHRHRQHQIPGLNNTPFVQIFVLETSSIDVYRSKLRQIGKNWFQTQVEVRDPTGFVVAHVVKPTDSAKATKAIWTRVISEFNPAHCIQLDAQSELSWRSLRGLVQQQLLAAFSARVDMLEREISKLNATRDIPGWNFGTLFAVHESLAWAFESMNLVEDALRVYQVLESLSREQLGDSVVATGGIEWSKLPQTVHLAFGGDRDALIEPMLARKAAKFDVMRHLLSCQTRLLLALASRRGKDVDSLADSYVLKAIRLAITHIPALMCILVTSVGRDRANEWLLRCCREIYDLTAEYGSSKLAQGKGDLILIERDALQSLAVARGYTTPGIFNDISLDSTEDESDKPEDIKLDELESIESYHAAFIKITKSAMTYFRVANLRRTVARLSGQLALMEYNLGNIDEAWNIFQKIPQHSIAEPNMMLLDMAMDCAERRGAEHKVIESAWRILSLKEAVPLKIFRRAIAHIESLASKQSMTHQLNSWFEPQLLPYLRGDFNGYYLELLLKPKRPDHPFICFDAARVVGTMASSFGPPKQITFETNSVPRNLVEPHKIKLYTRSFVQGVLTMQSLSLNYENQNFIHEFENVVLAMKPLTTAFHTRIRLAKKYTLKKRNVELLLTAINPVKKAKVTIQPVDPAVQLLRDQAEIPKLVNFTSATVSAPILVDYASPIVQLRVYVEYDDKMTYESLETLNFSLAADIDFQEHFRQPPVILAQFLAKPFSNAPLTFSGAQLVGSSNYSVDPDFGRQQLDKEYVAYLHAPVSYIFAISRKPVIRKNALPMRLSLTYRSMLAEVGKLLYEKLTSMLPAELQCYRLQVSKIVEELSSGVIMGIYVTKGTVDVPIELISDIVKYEFDGMDPEHMQGIEECVHKVFAEGVSRSNTDFSMINSEVTLDLPDPEGDTVHYVKLVPEEEDELERCSVGGVLSFGLEIDTVCLHEDAETIFEYEFDPAADEWTYTGKVKGTFKASESVREKLSLIPSRSGELLLPSVVIRQVDGPVDAIVISGHENMRVLVVPDVNMLAITF